MELDLLRELLALMDENELSELEVEQEGMRVRLKKSGQEVRHEVVTSQFPVAAASGTAVEPTAAETAAQTPPGLVEVVAPMVGTFYRAPSPDAEPYVTEGDVVDEDTAVCILEAMKVMNEIKAEKRGRVVEVLAENGDAVEYGQVLFRLDPNI